jgi:hypothetical protein
MMQSAQHMHRYRVHGTSRAWQSPGACGRHRHRLRLRPCRADLQDVLVGGAVLSSIGAALYYGLKVGARLQPSAMCKMRMHAVMLGGACAGGAGGVLAVPGRGRHAVLCMWRERGPEGVLLSCKMHSPGAPQGRLSPSAGCSHACRQRERRREQARRETSWAEPATLERAACAEARA